MFVERFGTPFPSLVEGAGGIVVSKSNGVWTIGFDRSAVTASVLRSAAFSFQTVPGASMKNFKALYIGDEDSDSYYVFNVERIAPIGGTLYGLLQNYLTSNSGPALSLAAATILLGQIWAAAPTFLP